MLRVKESEMQYLKQEINSLKDELQAAQRVRIRFSFKKKKKSPPGTHNCGGIAWLSHDRSLYLSCQTLYFQDKKYATDKYKDIYTELSIVKAKADRDLGRLRDQLQLAHEALGESSLEEVEQGGYGTETPNTHTQSIYIYYIYTVCVCVYLCI